MMDKKPFYTLIMLGFIASWSLMGVGIVFAQNVTNATTVREAVEQSASAAIASYVGIAISILTAVGLVLRLLGVEGKAAQAITIGVDGLRAVYDDRAKYAKFAGMGVGLSPEETQAFIRDKIIPVMMEGARRADEIKPKIDELTEFASQKGKAVHGINYNKKFGE
jgi:hypothetical protein